MSGKQIKGFLVDGTSGGIKTAEITNWTGHLIAGARSDLASLLQREELGRTGVYVLLGDDESSVGGIRCTLPHTRRRAATAQQIDGEFTVFAGSVVAPAIRSDARYSESTAMSYAGYRAVHDKLVADGSIVIEGGDGRLTRDTVFRSPSQAGAIVTGRSCNGRTEWVTEDGVSFGDWEIRGVE